MKAGWFSLKDYGHQWHIFHYALKMMKTGTKSLSPSTNSASRFYQIQPEQRLNIMGRGDQKYLVESIFKENHYY